MVAADSDEDLPLVATVARERGPDNLAKPEGFAISCTKAATLKRLHFVPACAPFRQSATRLSSDVDAKKLDCTACQPLELPPVENCVYSGTSTPISILLMGPLVKLLILSSKTTVSPGATCVPATLTVSAITLPIGIDVGTSVGIGVLVVPGNGVEGGSVDGVGSTVSPGTVV